MYFTSKRERRDKHRGGGIHRTRPERYLAAANRRVIQIGCIDDISSTSSESNMPCKKTSVSQPFRRYGPLGELFIGHPGILDLIFVSEDIVFKG